MGKLEAPPPMPDLSPILNVLETVTWEALDDEAWREVAALLVERVDVFGLGDYRMTWSAAGRSLAGVLGVALVNREECPSRLPPLDKSCGCTSAGQ